MKQFTDESAATVPESREKKLEDALFRVVESIVNNTIDARFADTLMSDHSTEKKLYYLTEVSIDLLVEILYGCGPAYDFLKKELDAEKAMMDDMEVDE